MTLPPANFIRKLAWDSKAFGFNVAKIENIQSPEEQLLAAKEQLKAKAIALAYWEAPKGDVQSRIAAEKIGGHLINSRVTLERGITAADSAPPLLRAISKPDQSQRAELNNLAISSGWSSRFAVDPMFPRSLFEQMYRTWMTESLSGRLADAVVVAEKEEQIVGMITVSARAKLGKIGLFSVVDRMRGKGVGKRLLTDAISWFAQQRCAVVQVTTQGENAGALAIYHSSGFIGAEQTDVFHFWRADT